MLTTLYGLNKLYCKIKKQLLKKAAFLSNAIFQLRFIRHILTTARRRFHHAMIIRTF